MKERILEIIRKHDAYLTTSKEMSTEISDMFRKFDEWKNSTVDYVFSFEKQYSFYIKNEYVSMTYDELFDYWYLNIREK